MSVTEYKHWTHAYIIYCLKIRFNGWKKKNFHASGQFLNWKLRLRLKIMLMFIRSRFFPFHWIFFFVKHVCVFSLELETWSIFLHSAFLFRLHLIYSHVPEFWHKKTKRSPAQVEPKMCGFFISFLYIYYGIHNISPRHSSVHSFDLLVFFAFPFLLRIFFPRVEVKKNLFFSFYHF